MATAPLPGSGLGGCLCQFPEPSREGTEQFRDHGRCVTGPGVGAEVGRGEALPEAGTIDQPRLQARASRPGKRSRCPGGLRHQDLPGESRH